MAPPLVSVIIPAFNAGRTIDRALASVFLQDYQPLEIIVIDDGSTDDTAGRVARYRDKMVRLLRLERNRGVAAATNAGLGVAKGEFTAFLDADDEWLPGKLRIQVPLLVANPSMPFVCSRWQESDQSGSVTEQPDPDLYRRPTHSNLWRDLLARGVVLKSTVVARSSYLDATGGFDARLSPADDQDMWIRLALLGAVGCRMEVLAVYHRTPGSLTRRYHLRERERLCYPWLQSTYTPNGIISHPRKSTASWAHGMRRLAVLSTWLGDTSAASIIWAALFCWELNQQGILRTF